MCVIAFPIEIIYGSMFYRQFKNKIKQFKIQSVASKLKRPATHRKNKKKNQMINCFLIQTAGNCWRYISSCSNHEYVCQFSD